MKDKITLFLLQLLSAFLSFVLITVIYVVIPFWAFVICAVIAFVLYLKYKADAEYKERTPTQQERLEKLYESPEYHNIRPTKSHNADELIQIAEMFRDSMEGSTAKESLAYKVTVKAIDNYYKTTG